MRIHTYRSALHSSLSALASAWLLNAAAQAAISGINSPGSNPGISYGNIIFNDTNSLNSSSLPGTTNITQGSSPWTGTSLTLPLTTDPVTFDTAKGNLLGTFGVPGPNDYAVSLNSVNLTQLTVNTGFATLEFRFEIEYQLDAAGLPSQPTLFPNFVVTGTVQPASGSFASVGGFIDYYGVNSAGVLGIVETVNYNQLFNTPGSFNGTVAGVPVNGVTPALGPNSTLTLVGDILFTVDPANISVETVAAPEPSVGLLALLGGLPLFLRRRRV